MTDVNFGSGANTPTGDTFAGAIIKLKGRVSPLEGGAQSLLGEFGINIQGMMPYLRGMAPVDLMRCAQMRVSSSIPNDPRNYQFVYDPSIDVSSPRINASEVGLDEGGWPTTVPSGLQIMMAWDTANRGFSQDQAGVYDCKFDPGLDWAIAGDAGMTRTAYNLSAGTATITITAETPGVSPRIVFNSYNGVPNTFPPYSPTRAFTAIKRGEDVNTFLTKASLATIKGLTSAQKPQSDYRGFVRFMTPNDINRPAIAGGTFNRTRTPPHVNRLGYTAGSGQFLIEHQVQVAKAIRANPWVNLPDTNTPEANKRIAQHLYDSIPTGMKFVVEWSNEIYFNFFGGFSQTGDLYNRSKINYPSTNGNLQRQYGIEVRQYMVEPFEQVFSFNDPRYIPVIGVQSAQANYNFINQVFFDAGDLRQRIKGICTGPYIAGGIASVSIGSYSEQSIFTKASRDKAGVDDAGFLDDMFAAQNLMSQKTYNQNHKTFLADKARYATNNGMPADRYMTLSYEFSWQHYNMTNHSINMTGSSSGNTLTVSANGNSPPFRVGDGVLFGEISGNGGGTQILEQLTGTTGGAGTYKVNNSQTTVVTKFSVPGAVFFGSITDTTLTVTSLASGTIVPVPLPADLRVTARMSLSPVGKIIEQTLATGAPGGVGTYIMDTAFTIGSARITSSTNMYARAVGRLLAQGLRDPRAGLAQVEQIQWLRKDDGGIHCLFDLSGSIPSLWDDNNNTNVTSGSNWGMEDRVGNEAIDDPYKSVKAYLEANG